MPLLPRAGCLNERSGDRFGFRADTRGRHLGSRSARARCQDSRRVSVQFLLWVNVEEDLLTFSTAARA